MVEVAIYNTIGQGKQVDHSVWRIGVVGHPRTQRSLVIDFGGLLSQYSLLILLRLKVHVLSLDSISAITGKENCLHRLP